MKKIYLSMKSCAMSTILMSLIGMASSVQAADKLYVISADPADGSTVESLKRINLELGNTTQVGVEWKSGLKAPVSDAEGNEVTTVSGAQMNSVFVLRLADEITEPGTYTVSVPAGAFYTPDWSAQVWPLPAVAGSENDAFTLTYTVESAASDNQLYVISADPADGSTVESLKRINLELGNTTQVGVEWKSGLKAPVSDAEGNEVTTVSGAQMNSVFVLRLADEITEPGTYTVSVPAGAFYTPDWSAQVWPLPAVAGSENNAFTLTYTVESAAPDNQLYVISADPADGSTVENLKRINLELGNTTQVGVEWKSGLKAPVSDAEGNEVTTVSGAQMNSVFVLRLADEITEPGTYTVSVPAGAFYTPDWSAQVWPLPAVAGSENDAFTLTYTVNNASVGVAGISHEESYITVDQGLVTAVGYSNPMIYIYSISGVEVARGNGSANVNPGIYVVKVVDADNTTVKQIVVK